MKRPALALTLAAIAALPPMGAQSTHHTMPPPVAASTAPTNHIPQIMLASLEKNFDDRLGMLNASDPIDMLGGTRALYVPGFGVVFTTEVSLVVAPGAMPLPYQQEFSPAQKAQVHKRKSAQLPKLEGLMKDLVNVCARTLTTMSDDQKVVVAVRLRYLMWEDTTDLPAQIVMTADKKSAQLGDIKTVIE